MVEPMKRGTMRYAIIALAAAFVLTACAIPAASPQATVTVTEDAPAPIPAPAPAPEPDTAQDADDLYMSLLASEGIYASRETSIEVGRSICQALDDGYAKTTLALIAVDTGFTEREAAALVAAAVVAYCPRHSS
jgi:hypothetical protein